MRITQKGMSLLGVLVVLAILGAAGYYIYQAVMETDTGPGCKDEWTFCMRYCRRTTTDDVSAQKCQHDCERAAEECNLRR